MLEILRIILHRTPLRLYLLCLTAGAKTGGSTWLHIQTMVPIANQQLGHIEDSECVSAWVGGWVGGSGREGVSE